jgi:hypothetical protein
MEPDNPLNNTAPAGGGLPDPSSMNMRPPAKKKNNLPLIAGAVLGVFVLLIVVLVVISSSNSNTSNQKLQAQYNAGYQKGQDEQKAASEKQFLAQQAGDVRVYKSDSAFGSFEVPIPKSWSWAIEPDSTTGTFLGKSDPSFVDLKSEFHNFMLNLTAEDYQQKIAEYEQDVKESGGKFVGSDFTVSGIKGKKYIGVVDKETGKKAEIVVIPLREKIIVFRCDDPDKYGASFETILSGTKLNP